jgi:hypothetical protein
MGSVHGLSVVHNAHEPRCTSLSPGFDGETKIKIKFKTKGRFMGSSHGLSVVHNAHEPTGTFNVQRSTFNGRTSTINLPTINRFMGSSHGVSSVHNAHEPTGTFNVRRSTGEHLPSTSRPSTGSWEAPTVFRSCIMPMNLVLCAADCKSALRRRFMGRVQLSLELQNAHERYDLALDPAPALALPSGSKSKSRSRERFMGGSQ